MNDFAQNFTPNKVLVRSLPGVTNPDYAAALDSGVTTLDAAMTE